MDCFVAPLLAMTASVTSSRKFPIDVNLRAESGIALYGISNE
jgi:hypothetical protein